ncbi:MAG TPA: S8 family serine peptidase [Kofleriaceae bacterium]|jgi:subtilisin-like proprotein convertase family protein|nr:S8 family serine peptidase [Kofleriaceae bacterium]
MKRFTKLLALSVVIAAGCGDSTGGPQAGGDDDSAQVSLPPEAIAQIEALLAEKAARTPVQKKIASSLLYMNSGRFATFTNTKDPKTHIKDLSQIDAKGRVLVDIKGDVANLKTSIEALGGVVVGTSTAHASARAWVAASQLESLASHAEVHSIKPALMAQTNRIDRPHSDAKHRVTREQAVATIQRAQAAFAETHRSFLPTPTGAQTNVGAVTSEGSTAMGAEAARKFYNVDGTGITVGVLSDSDDFKEAAIASGDLPADTITIPGQDGRPGGGEGTAIMEIVHDVAPGAKLVFATAFNGPDSFADNIRSLRFDYHCDIIIDDIIYFVENPYMDDIIAQAVEDISADGGLYFSSAGNDGNFNDGTSGTWEGDFKSAGALSTLPSGYTVHDFGAKVISNRVEVESGPLLLQWADPGTLDAGASSNDYDLFVMDEDLRNVAVASTDIQDGTGNPFEFLGFDIPPGFRVVIAAKPGAQKRALRLALSRGELGLSTPGATYGHNSAASAFGVAAVDAAEAGGGLFTAGPTTPVEVFSSDGPRRVFYDRNGNPIDPSNPGATFQSGAGQNRIKPDIAGADGVSTTLPGGSGLNPFFGTSAAAPHVGAIAALMKSAAPGATNAQIRTALLNGALDIAAAGTDRDSGHGIASAMNSLKKIGARPAVFLEEGTVTVTPNFSDVILPGGSGEITVQLINNGGAAATKVSAILSSSSPDVAVITSTSGYPNLAVGGSAVNSTAFAFAVSPSLPCGTKLPFTLTISYTGNGPHPVVLNFDVQTGRVDPTPTVFSYAGDPVFVPDGDPTGVDISLPVTFGPVAKLVFSLDGSACSADIGSTTVGVDHTWVGDLTFALTSPGGTTVNVIDRAGGPNNDGNNFCQTVIDEAASSSINDVADFDAPFTGSFTPTNSTSPFVGASANGTWNLHVTDNVFIDSGNVRAFSVAVSGFSCSATP